MSRLTLLVAVVIGLLVALFARPALAGQLAAVVSRTPPAAAAPFTDAALAAIATRPLDSFLSPEEQRARNEVIVARRAITPAVTFEQRGIADTAVLAPRERQVRVSGHLLCNTAQPHASVAVLVTQKATAAVAEGRTRTACATTAQSWEVQANAQGPNTFAAGPAQICALAEVFQHGGRIDLEQWCKEVLLVAQE